MDGTFQNMKNTISYCHTTCIISYWGYLLQSYEGVVLAAYMHWVHFYTYRIVTLFVFEYRISREDFGKPCREGKLKCHMGVSCFWGQQQWGRPA